MIISFKNGSRIESIDNLDANRSKMHDFQIDNGILTDEILDELLKPFKLKWHQRIRLKLYSMFHQKIYISSAWRRYRR